MIFSLLLLLLFPVSYHSDSELIFSRNWFKMADEDIQPLVCDNGTGMVKVSYQDYHLFRNNNLLSHLSIFTANSEGLHDIHWHHCWIVFWSDAMPTFRPDLQEMMLQGLCFLVLWVVHGTLVWWLGWARKMHMWGMRLSPSVVY